VHDSGRDYSDYLHTRSPSVPNGLESFFTGGFSRYENNGNYMTWWIEHFSSASAKPSLGTNYRVIIMPDSRSVYVYVVARIFLPLSLSLSLSLSLHCNSSTKYSTSETTLDLFANKRRYENTIISSM